jgi:hypothetical protein
MKITKSKDNSIIVAKQFGQNMSKKEIEYWKLEAERMYKEYYIMLSDWQNSNDSVQQLKYKDAIEPKFYSHTFENDTLTAKVYGMYLGAIPTMKLNYTIKERKQEVKLPKTIFRLLAGIEAGATTNLSKFNTKVNIGFQNKRGNIFSASFDSEQRIYLGYTASIFQIKK